MKYLVMLLLVFSSLTVSAQKKVKKEKSAKPIEEVIKEGNFPIVTQIRYSYVYKIEKPGADTTYHVKIHFLDRHSFDHYIYLDGKSELKKFITELQKPVPSKDDNVEPAKGTWNVLIQKDYVQILEPDMHYVNISKKQVKTIVSWLNSIERNNKLPE